MYNLLKVNNFLNREVLHIKNMLNKLEGVVTGFTPAKNSKQCQSAVRRGLHSFSVQKKFETTSVSKRAVVGGFIPEDLYAQKRVLVPCAIPVFTIPITIA